MLIHNKKFPAGGTAAIMLCPHAVGRGEAMTRLTLSLSFFLLTLAGSTTAQQAKADIPATTKSDEARQHYKRGVALGENSRTAEAIQELGQALKLDPGF